MKQHRIRQLEARLQVGEAWVDRGLVFCNVNGDYLPLTTLYDSFQALLKKAELPHIRFHDLRHSAATLLLSMGVPAKVIQELLGHSQISVTLNTYSHVLPSMQQEAMQKMNEVFKQQSQIVLWISYRFCDKTQKRSILETINSDSDEVPNGDCKKCD